MNLLAFTAAMLLAAAPESGSEEVEETSASAESTSPAVSEPAAVAPSGSWWRGEESIYDGGLNFSLSALFADYNGGKFKGRAAEGDVESAKVDGVVGIRGDLGTMGRHFGFIVLGLAYYSAGEGTELEMATGSGPADLKGVDVRLLQPRLRIALGRFEAAASLGPILHMGWAKLDESRVPGLGGTLGAAADSSVFANVGLEAGGGLRFYPLDILFVEGAYNYSFPLFDVLGELEGMNGFRVGAGLAF